MTINDEIRGILSEFKIPQNDGISYLLMLYFDSKPSYIPDMLIAQMNRTGIYYVDDKNSLQWRTPLFDGQETAFDWVKSDYVQLFVDANPEKRGNGNTSVRLMKKFFAANPEVRKEEVIEAVKMYIRNTDSKYIRLSHYFIEKGKGADKIEELKDWVNKYRIWQQAGVGRTGTSNTMQ